MRLVVRIFLFVKCFQGKGFLKTFDNIVFDYEKLNMTITMTINYEDAMLKRTLEEIKLIYNENGNAKVMLEN